MSASKRTVGIARRNPGSPLLWSVVAWAGLAVSLAACHEDLKLDELRFACAADEDCPTGWVCRSDGATSKECVEYHETPACSADCSTSEICCDETCHDPRTSQIHCGVCDQACGAGERCEKGVCTAVPCGGACTEGQLCCTGTDGKSESCHDPSTDEAHCGDCATACATGERCLKGACVPDPCPVFEPVAVTPSPGVVPLPSSEAPLEVRVSLSCPIGPLPESAETAVRVRSRLGGSLPAHVAVEASDLVVTTPFAHRGDQLSLEVLGLKNDLGDPLTEPFVVEYFHISDPVEGLGLGGNVGVFEAEMDVVAVEPADIDGDGDLDLVTATENRVVVSTFEDKEVAKAKAFALEVPWSGAVGKPLDLALADLDADGDLDVWLVTFGTHDRILLNETTEANAPVFREEEAGPETVSSRAVALADLDLDGDVDAVLGRGSMRTPDSPAIWRNNGDGTGTIELMENGAVMTTLDVAIGPVAPFRRGVAMAGHTAGSCLEGELDALGECLEAECHQFTGTELWECMWADCRGEYRPVVTPACAECVDQGMVSGFDDLLERCVRPPVPGWLHPPGGIALWEGREFLRFLTVPSERAVEQMQVALPGGAPTVAWSLFTPEHMSIEAYAAAESLFGLEPIPACGDGECVLTHLPQEDEHYYVINGFALADAAGEAQLDLFAILGDDVGVFPDYAGGVLRTPAAAISKMSSVRVADLVGDETLDLVTSEQSGVFVVPGVANPVGEVEVSPPSGGVLSEAIVEVKAPTCVSAGSVVVQGEQSGRLEAIVGQEEGVPCAVTFHLEPTPIVGERVHMTYLGDPAQVDGDERTWVWTVGGEPVQLSGALSAASFAGEPGRFAGGPAVGRIGGTPNALTPPDIAFFTGSEAEGMDLQVVFNDGAGASIASPLPWNPGCSFALLEPGGQEEEGLSMVMEWPDGVGSYTSSELAWDTWPAECAPVLDVGDVDRDGRLDLVTPTSVVLGDGSRLELEEGIHRLADLTGDGVLDIASLSSTRDDPSEPNFETLVHIRRGGADGIFGAAELRASFLFPADPQFPFPEFRLELAAGELDGQVPLELVVAMPVLGVPVPEVSSHNLVVFRHPDEASADLALVDVDGDAQLEIVRVVTSGDVGIGIYEVDFEHPLFPMMFEELRLVEQLGNGNWQHVVPTDWNRDGVLDLVVFDEVHGEVYLGVSAF